VPDTLIHGETTVALYMDQDLFNTLAFNVAWLRRVGTGDKAAATESAIRGMLGSYRQSYPEDRFEPDLWKAVDAFESWLVRCYPNQPEQSAWFKIFCHAVEHFQPDGRRKRKPLFNGVWFTSPRTLPPNRFERFMKDVGLYFLNVQSGKISPENAAKGTPWGFVLSVLLATLPGYEATRHHAAWVAIAVYCVVLAVLQFLERRDWKLRVKVTLKIVVALCVEALVLVSAMEICDAQQMACHRVFF
jgi:hypothetical protein